MDKTFLLSDGKMKEACLLAVKKYCIFNRLSGNFNVDKIIGIASDEFKKQYRMAKGYTRSYIFTRKDIEELTCLHMQLWSRIEEDVRKMALSYAQDYKAKQITKVAAENFIRDVLSDAGFDNCIIECQFYRAKVTVIMPSKYKMMFIVKYKDMMEGRMESILEQFLELTRRIEALPFQVKIWK